MSLIEYVKDVIEGIRDSKKMQAEVDARNAAYEKEMARRKLEQQLEDLMEPSSFSELRDRLKEMVIEIKGYRQSMHAAYKLHNERVQKVLSGGNLPDYMYNHYAPGKLEFFYGHINPENPGYHDFMAWRAGQRARLYSLAYGLMRGRTIEQMESKVAEHNKLCSFHLNEINKIIVRCGGKAHVN